MRYEKLIELFITALMTDESKVIFTVPTNISNLFRAANGIELSDCANIVNPIDTYTTIRFVYGVRGDIIYDILPVVVKSYPIDPNNISDTKAYRVGVEIIVLVDKLIKENYSTFLLEFTKMLYAINECIIRNPISDKTKTISKLVTYAPCVLAIKILNGCLGRILAYDDIFNTELNVDSDMFDFICDNSVDSILTKGALLEYIASKK